MIVIQLKVTNVIIGKKKSTKKQYFLLYLFKLGDANWMWNSSIAQYARYVLL